MKKNIYYFSFSPIFYLITILYYKSKTSHLSKSINFVIFFLLFNSITYGQSETVSISSDVTQICKGSAVTFTANASGTPDYYEWQVSHDGGANFNTILNQNNSTYTTYSLLNNDKVKVIASYSDWTSFPPMFDVPSNEITVQVNETKAGINTISTASSGSVKFNGTNQYLTLSNPPNYGTGAFTIDGWFRLEAAPLGDNAPILGSQQFQGLSVLIKNNLSNIVIDVYGHHGDPFDIPTLTLGRWHHLAVVRNSSGFLTVFFDGQRSSTGTISESISFTSTQDIGRFQSNYFSGFLSNLRMVTGTALYDPTQTSITIPTSLTTAVTNTKLLLNAVSASSMLTDGSGTQSTITNNGNATWSGGTPFVINLNSSSNATISNATAGGVWSSSNNSILQVNSSGVLTPVATGSATITYTVTSNTPITCVSSELSLFTTAVTPPPTASPQSKCSGSTVSSLAATGTDLKWYDVASGGNALSASTALATGTYYVSSTLNGQESDRTSVMVTVNALPATPNGTNGARCSTGTVIISATPASGETIDWYDVSSGGTVLANGSGVTSFTTPSISTTTIYYAEARNTTTGCVSATRRSVTATVDVQVTTATAGADQTLCNTSTFTMAGNSPTSGTGAWSLVSGSATITSASSATTTITSVPTNSNITLRWTITNGTCSSTDDVVIRNSLPNATISVTPSSCSTTLSVPSSSSYLWSNGSTSSSISVVSSGSYSVTVTDAYGCTNSSSSSVTVSDNTAPTMNCVANGSTNNVYNNLAAGGVSNTNDKSFANISRWAQKFTAGSSGSISNIKLNIYRDQISTTGSFEVQIWDGNSTTPSAKLVTLKTLNWPDMPLNTTGTNNSSYFGITSFDTNFTLMSGTAYWLVISQASNGPAPKRWTISGTGNQTASYNQNNGTWTDRGTTNNLGAQITISDPIRKTSVNCTYVTAGTEFDPVCSDNCGINSTSYSLSGATSASGSSTLAGIAFNKGVTNVTWTTSDNAGNTSSCSYTVTVVDDDAPVISLNGSSTVNICKGNSYNDNGATASDNCDGNISANIISSGTVNTAVAGSYTLSYNVSDLASNAATTVTRTVVVNPLPDATVTASGATTFNYGGSVVLSAPISGNALSLNGTSNYVSIPAAVNTNFSGGQITLEGWFYATSTFSLASLIAESLGTDNNVKFGISSELVSGVQKIYAGFSNGGTSVQVISSANLSLNTWTHISANYDGSTLKIFVNGIQTGTVSNAAGLPGGSDAWFMGRGANGSNYFPGKMDEVRIWNVVRTQSEIQNSMNAVISTSSTGLVGYYKLDEASGSSAADATGHGYTGTVN